MRLFFYIGRRLMFFVPQIFGIACITFFLVKMIPGDPVNMMLGPMATNESIAQMRGELGLDKPLPVQFLAYLKNLAHGDLGVSWQTTNPVAVDLLQRFPATLELISFGMILSIAFGVPLGIATAYKKTGLANRVANIYGLLAGSFPDFWIALVFIFIFYTVLGWVPSPLGRLDVYLMIPPRVTGFYTIDSLIAGDFEAFRSAITHLALPSLSLAFVYAGAFLKITQVTMDRMLNSDFSRYGHLCGLKKTTVTGEAFRNSLPSVVTLISVLFGFLLGGAVLVEIVFSWGGAGQYAVQGVLASDINPVLGFVVVSAAICVLIYLIVDLINFAIDPRISQ